MYQVWVIFVAIAILEFRLKINASSQYSAMFMLDLSKFKHLPKSTFPPIELVTNKPF